ncbi:Oidioi.mRNA.OKI2018_I69.chr2.g4185.t1.cds [Oikopleura dioica]|uniref:Oidioi.mRNA.OKI2018_I69.chr2.g4185.t1.cds n=1 Tax=Oikopleura dioica TaxID=34765 RepID=A0ABN7SY48_OIKDI|nr:Oidioi.mRNA.OKI2018_I69.chr2.g4185.t1.cds [Oikopleura dioica]
MKLFNALIVATLAGKGGKKKAEREAAKAAAKAAAEAAEAAAAAAAAAAAEAERLAFEPEDDHIYPGGIIQVDAYGDNEELEWTVLANDADFNSLTFQFTEMNIDWRKDGCDDYVKIQPYSELGEELTPAIFCGPNGQETPFMVMEDPIFPYQKGRGQKGWNFQWDTYGARAIVTFVSDDAGNGGSFTLKVNEVKRENPCRTRADCIHVGDEKHICDFNELTKEKVCTEVDCTNHRHCKDGSGPDGIVETCRDNKCGIVECTSRDHCGDQQVCENTACVDVECRSHSHCPRHADGRPQRCNATKCEPVECLGKSDCGDTGICDANVCTNHECLGHASCEDDFPGKCADGICKCEGRKCIVKECTKHAHCPDGGLCDNNPNNNPTFECYNEHPDGAKTCRSHAQCGAKAKCENKKCVAVECRTNGDCLGKTGANAWRCADESFPEEEQNKCYAVGCNKHDQCGSKSVCIDNECVPTECRTNADCDGNALCDRPDKADPTKNSCKPVDCVGHKACLTHSNADCQAGKCLCLQNQCKPQTCVTSAHCGAKERCHNNQCVEAQCSGHGHCAEAIPDGNGGFKPAKCFPNCETIKGRKYCLPECRAVECRVEADCDPSVPEICDKKTNTCKKVGCRGHSFCQDQELCQNNECVLQECTTNAHCDASNSEVCKDNKCEKVGCIGHAACGYKERCINHTCVPRECTDNSHCKGTGVFAKCDKIAGVCEPVECIGHTSCNRLSETGLGEDCTDGKCLCVKNECVKKQCRVNAHCGSRERCQANVCQAVDCTDHAHCGAQEVCKENVCIDVECRTREHCGDKQVCGGEDNGNKCKNVDCIGHADCENFGSEDESYICSKNSCVPVECRTNEDCGSNSLCQDNLCKSVDCDSHAVCESKYDDTYRCYKNTCVQEECRNNSHCNVDELCDRQSLTCKKVECRGHQMCQDNGVVGCEDGHCLCKSNECEVQECRTNAHCGVQERCQENRCVPVACTSHDHCLNSVIPGCADGKCRCEANECVAVACRTANHCDADTQICSGENPEEGEPNVCIDVECKSHTACGPQNNCIDFKCVSVQCTDESHCGPKELCRKSKCEEVECRSHAHCEGFFQDTGLDGYKCVKQQCVNVECTNNDMCGDDKLCDKATNTCYEPQCIGHQSCQSKGVPGCENGHCTCIGNNCIANQCRTNDHCGWPNQARLCRNLECVDVGCTTHDHCKNAAGGGPTSYCQGNECVHGSECLVTSDCPADEPYVCNSTTKKCDSVECNRNTDCLNDSAICVGTKCIEQECRTSVNCPAGQICVDNICIE